LGSFARFSRHLHLGFRRAVGRGSGVGFVRAVSRRPPARPPSRTMSPGMMFNSCRSGVPTGTNRPSNEYDPDPGRPSCIKIDEFDGPGLGREARRVVCDGLLGCRPGQPPNQITLAQGRKRLARFREGEAPRPPRERAWEQCGSALSGNHPCLVSSSPAVKNPVLTPTAVPSAGAKAPSAHLLLPRSPDRLSAHPLPPPMMRMPQLWDFVNVPIAEFARSRGVSPDRPEP